MRASPVLGSPELVAGLVCASITYGVVATVMLAARACPIARRYGGLAFPAGALVGLEIADVSTRGLTLGTAVLATAGWASLRWRSTTGVAVALLGSCCGAVLVGFWSDLPTVDWLRIVVAATVALAAPLAVDFDRRHASHGLGPVIVAGSVVGLYLAVPDTEAPLVLVGACAPALAAAFVLRVSLGAAGAPAMMGICAWVAAFGARGHPVAAIGAIGGLGLLVVEPIGQILRKRRSASRRPVAPFGRPRTGELTMVAVHALTVVIASRVIATQDRRVDALLGVAALWGATLALVLPLKSSSRDAPSRQAPNR